MLDSLRECQTYGLVFCLWMDTTCPTFKSHKNHNLGPANSLVSGFQLAMDFLPTTVGGLPLHPLVVHFSVVLLPLAAFALLIAIFIPRFRKGYAFASLVGLFLGAGATVVAKQTGESLAAKIGLPQTHANYGGYLQIAAIVLFLLSLIWYRTTKVKPSIKPNGIGYLTAVVSIAVLGLTFLTGHTGAEAVWKNKLASLDQSTAPTPTPSASASESKSSSSAKSTISGYSLSDVAKHASSSSCWSAIDGNVYDLTNWINRHPGGAEVIKAICGKDGSASFNGQHSGERRPAMDLSRYKLGQLVG
jgi:uncharacterized membrane protein